MPTFAEKPCLLTWPHKTPWNNRTMEKFKRDINKQHCNPRGEQLLVRTGHDCLLMTSLYHLPGPHFIQNFSVMPTHALCLTSSPPKDHVDTLRQDRCGVTRSQCPCHLCDKNK